MKYTPDRWAIVEIEHDGKKYYKILGSWYGGYSGADSWRLNSGIKAAKLEYSAWVVAGHSGSEYVCPTNCYGTSAYTGNMVRGLRENKEISLRVLTEQDADEYLKSLSP